MANNFILPISTQTADKGRIGVVKISNTPSTTGIDIQTDGTLQLALVSGLTAGTYLKTTVDSFGRITSGSNADIVISNTAKVTSATTLAAGSDATKVFTVQDSASTPIFSVAQSGLTTIRSNVAFASGTGTDEAFRVESSDATPLFQVMTNGDAIIGGIIKVKGTGTSEFNGDVSIGGKLSVDGTIVGGTTATIGNDFTVNGKLVVKGDSDLGDDASTDRVNIKALTKVISPTTKATGSSTTEAFIVADSADVPLFQVMQNGDAIIGGIIKVKGTGTSEFAGDVSIGGHLTVMSGATINGVMQNDTLTLTGNLTVNGNTQLGDNSTTDTTVINGVTTVVSPTTKAAGTAAAAAFLVKSSDNIELFKVSTNGDASIAGKLTVAQGATVSAAMTGSDLTLSGNLVVNGNTTLGDNAAADTTTIKGLTTVISKATKAAGSSATNVFLVKSSDSQELLSVRENGDTIVGGKITISGSGSSAIDTDGDVSITGNLTVSGATTLNGNVTLGDATGDTIVSKAALNMSNNKITNLADPSANTDAATKQYVDSVIQGLDIKQSVRFATTANLAATYAAGGKTLTASAVGVMAAIDGVTPVAGNRVLVKNQTTATQNGIYTITNVGTASVAWVMTRAADFDDNTTASSGSFVFVEEGTANGNTGWVMTTDSVVLDTSVITWTQFAGAGAVNGGTGIGQSGNTLTLLPATTTTIGGIIASDTTNTTIDASGNLSIKSATANTANYIVRRDASGGIAVGAITATAVSSTGAIGGTNLTASGTLAVTGVTTLTGALTANGGVSTTTLSTSSNATIGGTLTVTGTTTLNGVTTLNGAVTLGDTTGDAINIVGKIGKISNVAVTGTYGVQAVGANNSDLVVGTTATTVATFAPSANGNHIIYLYVRMAASTTLSIDLSYNDGAAQTLNIMSGSQAIGSYSVSPVFIYAKTGTAITVTATAGAATSAYVSANIAGF